MPTFIGSVNVPAWRNGFVRRHVESVSFSACSFFGQLMLIHGSDRIIKNCFLQPRVYALGLSQASSMQARGRMLGLAL